MLIPFIPRYLLLLYSDPLLHSSGLGCKCLWLTGQSFPHQRRKDQERLLQSNRRTVGDLEEKRDGDMDKKPVTQGQFLLSVPQLFNLENRTFRVPMYKSVALRA